VCADSARCGRGRRERCKYVVYSSALLQYFSNYSGPGGCAVPPRPRLHCLQTSGGGRNHGLAQHRFSCFESVVTSAAAIVRNSRAFAKSPGTSHFARAWYCTLCLSFQLRAAAQWYMPASGFCLFCVFIPRGRGFVTSVFAEKQGPNIVSQSDWSQREAPWPSCSNPALWLAPEDFLSTHDKRKGEIAFEDASLLQWIMDLKSMWMGQYFLV
jgi:hypothetical protein